LEQLADVDYLKPVVLTETLHTGTHVRTDVQQRVHDILQVPLLVVDVFCQNASFLHFLEETFWWESLRRVNPSDGQLRGFVCSLRGATDLRQHNSVIVYWGVQLS
jgi:hypothetical protein